jgi:peptide chain release factor 1
LKDSIRTKLENTRDRFEEISALLADPDVISKQNQFRELSKEYSRLEPVIALFSRFENMTTEIAAAEEMANDSDRDIR